MHYRYQWQDLNSDDEQNTTVSKPVDRLWRLTAQMTLLGGRYTGNWRVL